MIIIEFTGGGAKHKFSLKGFTLAEVLITLGVIGIVSVMTLPALIANNRNKELENGLKKAYSVMGQALDMYQAERGDGVTPQNTGYHIL